MGTLTEKRPDATSGSGKRMKMSARDAVGLIRRAKRRGAKVDVKPALAKPTGPVQRKAGCSLCAMAGGSGPETAPAGYSCPLCSGKGGVAGPALEAPRDSVQHKGAGTADAAEAQADVLGAQIGAELGGAGSVSSGPIPSGVRSVAERHLGVGLSGTELRADAGAHARTASVGALAMTEGSTVSFGAGQLSTSTAAGRSLLGHELTHVAQQRAHGTAARQGFLGFGDDEEEGPQGEQVSPGEQAPYMGTAAAQPDPEMEGGATAPGADTTLADDLATLVDDLVPPEIRELFDDVVAAVTSDPLPDNASPDVRAALAQAEAMISEIGGRAAGISALSLAQSSQGPVLDDQKSVSLANAMASLQSAASAAGLPVPAGGGASIDLPGVSALLATARVRLTAAAGDLRYQVVAAPAAGPAPGLAGPALLALAALLNLIALIAPVLVLVAIVVGIIQLLRPAPKEATVEKGKSRPVDSEDPRIKVEEKPKEVEPKKPVTLDDVPQPIPRVGSPCDRANLTGETSSFVGWLDSFGMWSQILRPSVPDLAGCVVTEQRGERGRDECYRKAIEQVEPIPPVERFSAPTDGDWLVRPGNVWGPDFVGYTPEAIAYYTAHRLTPCGTTFDVKMAIFKSGVAVPYTTVRLSAGIEPGSVTSGRNGVVASRVWP